MEDNHLGNITMLRPSPLVLMEGFMTKSVACRVSILMGWMVKLEVVTRGRRPGVGIVRGGGGLAAAFGRTEHNKC